MRFEHSATIADESLQRWNAKARRVHAAILSRRSIYRVRTSRKPHFKMHWGSEIERDRERDETGSRYPSIWQPEKTPTSSDELLPELFMFHEQGLKSEWKLQSHDSIGPAMKTKRSITMKFCFRYTLAIVTKPTAIIPWICVCLNDQTSNRHSALDYSWPATALHSRFGQTNV